LVAEVFCEGGSGGGRIWKSFCVKPGIVSEVAVVVVCVELLSALSQRSIISSGEHKPICFQRVKCDCSGSVLDSLLDLHIRQFRHARVSSAVRMLCHVHAFNNENDLPRVIDMRLNQIRQILRLRLALENIVHRRKQRELLLEALRLQE
jgi:hypothetical protein